MLFAIIVFLFALVPLAECAGPIVPVSMYCDRAGTFIADSESLCFFWLCLPSREGMTAVKRRCALGTRTSEFYISGLFNPCTVNSNRRTSLEPAADYICQRESTQFGLPPCADELTCFNGGTLRYENDRCWCECSPEWTGDYDCSSRPILDKPIIPASNICVNGKPQKDWCREAGGCLNGGICNNQCDDYWCQCPSGPNHGLSVYTGKRCELKQGPPEQAIDLGQK